MTFCHHPYIDPADIMAYLRSGSLESEAVSCSVVSDSLQPHGLYSPPGFSVHGDSPGRNTGVGCHVFLQRDLLHPGIKPWYPLLQADSLLYESWFPRNRAWNRNHGLCCPPRSLNCLLREIPGLSYSVSHCLGTEHTSVEKRVVVCCVNT